MNKLVQKTAQAALHAYGWAKSKARAVAVTSSVAAAAVSAPVHAAAVDVSAVTTDIAAQAAPIAAIGGAVLLIYIGVKAFKWVRSALQ